MSPSPKPIRTRCPHCSAINTVNDADTDGVFECAHCEKRFRLRKKVTGPPPAPTIEPVVKRFPIRCTCQAKLLVTYADFGKRVQCQSCKQTIRIPDWVAESKFTEAEFDDMFSAQELQAIRK
ncbi:hypothetical protein [Neorhodopirellula pilleata]|uniref:Uncharacterized protein n=1 Tax=Neorhodopirellula pilleata TaxID=2714738 RepID=A0A5C6A379_9BACT|nr:hypothetical protein [Neorhodopirellula pilleata]TWT94364.1 hypothetical protein Pla100_39760 [Neorhodopirellula pilleata]